MHSLAFAILLATQAPGGAWDAEPLDEGPGTDIVDDDDEPTKPITKTRARPTGGELPVLSWQREKELESTFRQGLVKVYLDLLADPNDYVGVHRTNIPNDVNDWSAQRTDVKARLWQMRSGVDQQQRRRMGVSESTLRRMMAAKQDFRPEHLALLLHKMPRIDDAVITLHRVQPLGGDTYRLDYDVQVRLGGFSRTTRFQAVDATLKGDKMTLPMRVLADISLTNERDIFGNEAPVALSTPAAAASPASGVQGFLRNILGEGNILLDIFNL